MRHTARYILKKQLGISIHALLWSATRGHISFETRRSNFYPRTPVECDSNALRNSTGSLYFYPRTPVECDEVRGSLFGHRGNFYPRTPVECDQNGYIRFGAWFDFYPRTPVECDSLLPDLLILKKISIHALLWSATPIFANTPNSFAYFYPRTPVECDCIMNRPNQAPKHFYPRTPVECDPSVLHRFG